jgi:glucan 1,3-beta-glucosidase
VLTQRSLANGFSYWQYQELSNATKTYFYDMAQALGHVQDLTGSLDGIHFMNGGKTAATQ